MGAFVGMNKEIREEFASSSFRRIKCLGYWAYYVVTGGGRFSISNLHLNYATGLQCGWL